MYPGMDFFGLTLFGSFQLLFNCMLFQPHLLLLSFWHSGDMNVKSFVWQAPEALLVCFHFSVLFTQSYFYHSIVTSTISFFFFLHPTVERIHSVCLFWISVMFFSSIIPFLFFTCFKHVQYCTLKHLCDIFLEILVRWFCFCLLMLASNILMFVSFTFQKKLILVLCGEFRKYRLAKQKASQTRITIANIYIPYVYIIKM